METSVLKVILNEYEIKRNNAIQQAESRKRELLSVNPRLSEIETELANISIKTAKLILQSENSAHKQLLTDLKKRSTELIKEKNKFLKDLAKDSNYLKPHFECKHCKDTGYLEKNGISTMCHCLKQQLFNIFYNKSNIGNLEKENFSKFNSNIFSAEKNTEIYKSNLSPRENIEFIKEKSQNFIESFDQPDEKNLLFTGNTGLGKTFMTNCIANEFLSSRKNRLVSDCACYV